MAQHRMMSDWFEPAGEVRFLSHTGELFNAADPDYRPIASPPTPLPRRRHLAVGAPWDEVDADDIMNTVGGWDRVSA